MNQESFKRKVAILFGLYFSKFDEEAIASLGFKGPTEAFNTVGYAIGVKPLSIKNYRDEFDPFFDNPRKGWHNRHIREYCKSVMEEYKNIDFDSFTEIVKGYLFEGYSFEKFVDPYIPTYHSESVAKRLITGKSAEEYFRKNYQTVPQFEDFQLLDARLLACGFDFKLENNADFYCVEVKGLQGKTGTLTLTENEFIMAQNLRDLFVLYIVTNFVEKPIPKVIFNPLSSALKFTKSERTIKQINFSTVI